MIVKNRVIGIVCFSLGIGVLIGMFIGSIFFQCLIATIFLVCGYFNFRCCNY